MDKEEFIQRIAFVHGGYGLGQWCTEYNLNNFYDYAKQWGGSIGDAKMQCYFTIENLQNDYSEIWELLQETTDADEAGRIIAIFYEGTSEGVEYVGKVSQFFYNNYLNDVFLLPNF